MDSFGESEYHTDVADPGFKNSYINTTVLGSVVTSISSFINNDSTINKRLYNVF